MQKGFLRSGLKDECLGCEACVQICPHAALTMVEDTEGFRYPKLNPEACIDCGLCHKTCPEEEEIQKHKGEQKAVGGYAKDEEVRCLSTSGGAFSCIVESWCKDNYVIFGAKSDGLEVYHSYVTDKAEIGEFRKSKYSQSKIKNSYSDVRKFLKEGRNVLFSGTPCQIAGLLKFLSVGKNDLSRLLTVEVVCEGVPSPLYIRKMDRYMMDKYGYAISTLDYRYKDGRFDKRQGNRAVRRKGRWDYEVMSITLENGTRLNKDRWFNPFWSIWLSHLMNRPSCYTCPFTTRQRVADITLGDLWGVHIYCPDLYGNNGGSSLMVSNTPKGHEATSEASKLMISRGLDMDEVVRYQGPMRKSINLPPQRKVFMADLENPTLTISDINTKWSKKPTIKLLFSKYIWGNQQKVRFWRIKNYFSRK